jgi:hypothetical protein
MLSLLLIPRRRSSRVYTRFPLRAAGRAVVGTRFVVEPDKPVLVVEGRPRN